MHKTFLLDLILYASERRVPALPVVDHYAGTERFMYKALALQASKGAQFDLTLDFEDGSAADREQEQADLIVQVLNDPANTARRVGIRIHDATSRFWRLQCERTLQPGLTPPAYITLPKVTSQAQVTQVLAYIDALRERSAIVAPIPLHVMVESPCVLPQLQTIVQMPAVECVSFGLLDYVSSFNGAVPMSVTQSPREFDSPLLCDVKVRIATLCHAAHKVPSHSICSELKDTRAIHAHAKRAFQGFGFTRMWSIHPDQIEPILQAARYPMSELEQATQILLQARAQGWAPIRFHDTLHDRASYRYFWSILKHTQGAGGELPHAAHVLFEQVDA